MKPKKLLKALASGIIFRNAKRGGHDRHRSDSHRRHVPYGAQRGWGGKSSRRPKGLKGFILMLVERWARR